METTTEYEHQIGDIVRVTGHYTFAGQETHGRLAKVIDVQHYPAGVIEGDAIVSAVLFDGLYTEGTPAFGMEVPFAATLISSLVQERHQNVASLHCARCDVGPFFYVRARGDRALFCIECEPAPITS